MNLSKNNELSREMKDLKRILNKIPKDRKTIGQSLFNELEFMQRTLQTLKDQVDLEGPTAMLTQGPQKMLIQHPALKGYCTTVQRYSLLYKQFTDLLPPSAGTQQTDPLLDFIRGR